MGIIPECATVVRELGGFTGDRIFLDSNGDVWVSDHGVVDDTTGSERARIIENIIVPGGDK